MSKEVFERAMRELKGEPEPPTKKRKPRTQEEIIASVEKALAEDEKRERKRIKKEDKDAPEAYRTAVINVYRRTTEPLNEPGFPKEPNPPYQPVWGRLPDGKVGPFIGYWDGFRLKYADEPPGRSTLIELVDSSLKGETKYVDESFVEGVAADIKSPIQKAIEKALKTKFKGNEYLTDFEMSVGGKDEDVLISKEGYVYRKSGAGLGKYLGRVDPKTLVVDTKAPEPEVM